MLNHRNAEQCLLQRLWLWMPCPKRSKLRHGLLYVVFRAWSVPKQPGSRKKNNTHTQIKEDLPCFLCFFDFVLFFSFSIFFVAVWSVFLLFLPLFTFLHCFLCLFFLFSLLVCYFGFAIFVALFLLYFLKHVFLLKPPDVWPWRLKV